MYVCRDHAFLSGSLTVHGVKRVAKAALAVLGTTVDIAHELLAVGADALQFVPIPALDVVARALLSIWDAAKMVEVSAFEKISAR